MITTSAANTETYRSPSAGKRRPHSHVLASLIERGANLPDPDAWPENLDEFALVDFLKHVKGLEIAPATLRKRRVVGGGPGFRKIGPKVVYPRDIALDWADKQFSQVIYSTSEL